ncbi:MAG: fibronectin type III domain-containing protein, partial [Leptospira sp.]|nr:fibronectin type III domain-containing protein [Leptospira sp.]
MSLKRINFFYEIFFFGSLLFCTGCSPSKLDNPNDLGSKNFLEIEFIKCYLGQDGAVCRKSVNQAINFSGLSSTKILNSSQILLGWNAATSSETSAGNILYDVYRSTTSGTQNFSSPVFTTALGATSATISGLTNTNDYYFVVRARDILGNSDTNTIQKTVLIHGLVRYYYMDST